MTGQDPQQWLAEAQAAQKAREYEQTAQLLIAIQRQQQRLNEQQAEAYTRQMRSFQSDLAAGVAAGDPQAMAAARRLRASAGR